MPIYELYWEPAADGGARLLRVFGTTPEAALPETVEGRRLTEIGAYCFAERVQLPEEYHKTRIECGEAETPGQGVASEELRELSGGSDAGQCGMPGQGGASEELRELSGGYTERIVLPDAVEKVGNFAFYNAVSLNCLEIGAKLTGIGSDAFMNCRKLQRMRLRCERGEKTGLSRILAQIPHDMEVTFCGGNGVWARVLFPEYYESYDEIAPAHIFGRNIEGEGFRARQSFRDGVMDFAQYDTIFPKACAEEQEETLCRLALDRLRWSEGLGAEAKRLYEEYLLAHTNALCARIVQERDMELASFCCGQQIFARADVQCCIRLAAEAQWVEGSAGFMRLLEQYFPQKMTVSRYTFEDF